MKDPNDKKTIDFIGGRAVGRPRKYGTNAERQRAYRNRLKLLKCR